MNGIDFNDSMQRVTHEAIEELDTAAKNLDINFQFTLDITYMNLFFADLQL